MTLKIVLSEIDKENTYSELFDFSTVNFSQALNIFYPIHAYKVVTKDYLKKFTTNFGNIIFSVVLLMRFSLSLL